MKLFGKELTSKEKRDMLARIILIVLLGTVLIVSAVTTSAWFANNTTVKGAGMRVAVKADSYQLLVKREDPREFEKTIGNGGEAAYPGMVDYMIPALTAAGYDHNTFISTADRSMLAFELISEIPSSTDGGVLRYSIAPGSYGTLTFYLRPLKDEDLTVDFRFDICAYSNVYDDDTGITITGVRELDAENSSDASVLDLLKGHLLFFRSRSTNNNGTQDITSDDFYTYDDLITDGSFSYSTGGNSKSSIQGYTDCYEITLYWIWPPTHSDIMIKTAVYPDDVRTYLNDNKSYFFTNYDVDITGMSSDEISDLYNDGYNNADQKIGDTANYVVVNIY